MPALATRFSGARDYLTISAAPAKLTVIAARLLESACRRSYHGTLLIMPLIVRSRAGRCLAEQTLGRSVPSAVMLTFALFLLNQPASAQSGSAGGSLGDDEKSLSGSRAPRSVDSSAPARSRKPAREKPRAARSGGGSANVDGAWMVVSVGRPCGGASEAVVISSGRIAGQYTSGQVGPNGQATGAGSANGISWTSSGRFSGRSGSGSFRRSDGCVGTWTASKQ